MKFFTILILISLTFAASAGEDIPPHYKVYPKTPAESYKGAELDFYSVKNPYGEFSNFALFPIVIDERVWPSSEHFYQAQKFFDYDLQERVRNAPTPFEAAKIGRDPNLPLREDWDVVKDSFMLIALRAKYSQWPVLKELLLSTNDAHLYEHTTNDCYWADCGDRTGLNRLGEELMQVRSELRKSTTVHE